MLLFCLSAFGNWARYILQFKLIDFAFRTNTLAHFTNTLAILSLLVLSFTFVDQIFCLVAGQNLVGMNMIMAIFQHKLPYKKNTFWLWQFSPMIIFLFTHDLCIALLLKSQTGKGNEWEAFTFYKALAVTIWLVLALQKEIFLFQKAC